MTNQLFRVWDDGDDPSNCRDVYATGPRIAAEIDFAALVGEGGSDDSAACRLRVRKDGESTVWVYDCKREVHLTVVGSEAYE